MGRGAEWEAACNQRLARAITGWLHRAGRIDETLGDEADDGTGELAAPEKAGGDWRSMMEADGWEMDEDGEVVGGIVDATEGEED